MSATTVKGVVIVGAKRTAFGTLGGKLAQTSITELQTVANKAALIAANVQPELVDSVIIGNVLPISSSDGIYMARHSSLKSGIPIEKTSLVVNRLCGSGFQSIVSGIQEIVSGVSRIVLTGGVENMSQCPFVVRNIRFGTTFSANYQLEDSMFQALTDSYCNIPMALTAEKLGEQNNITRDDVDKFSLRSQMLWKAAQDGGRFKEEIVPIPVKTKKGQENFEVDEHPRPQSTLESLQKLKSLFKKDGLVTGATASGICDGSAAVVIASDEASSKYNLKPLARILAYSTVGVDPTIMGIGPVPAIQNLLKVSGLSLKDIDLIEINEAFAAQVLSCAKQLNLDMDKFNVDGGAIALGHPLGASGSRITTHLVYELRRRKAKYGIGSACIGGGQGIALLIEAL